MVIQMIYVPKGTIVSVDKSSIRVVNRNTGSEAIIRRRTILRRPIAVVFTTEQAPDKEVPHGIFRKPR